MNTRHHRPLGKIRTAALVAALLATALSSLAAAPENASSADDVLHYLDQTIDWYRRVASLDQSQADPEEVIFRDSVSQNSRQALRLVFDFGRAAGDLLKATQPPATAPGNDPEAVRQRNLARAAATASQRVAQVQAQINDVDQQMKSSATSRPELSALREKLVAELNLAKARNDVLQNATAFMTGRQAGGGLRERVDDLERAVPELQGDVQPAPAAKAGAVAVAAAQKVRPESMGVIGLITEMFRISSKMTQLKGLAEQAESLRQQNEKLRLPLRTDLINALRRGDALAQTRPAETTESLHADRLELDALAQHFTQLAKATMPLGQESVFLESSRTNLLAWRGALSQSFHNILRHLLIRVGGMVLAMLVVLGISRVWKRATFRYVADPRRRAQFLMLRRIVVGCMIVFIILATVVTEFGSLATFAGLITAGIAVALQTVILSGVAYFFFIGRYGVRVGERVTISGITGDVIDLGLFRLYLMELAGSGRDLSPTGRVVVFSNAVLFQPQAFFKQIPGADFNWHEVSITLSSETDPQVAETRLLGAVNSVYNEYRDNLQRQYATVKTAMHVPIPPPHPESRLRFVDTGLEFVIRYPVEIHRSAEIDDRVTRKLLDLIRTDPALKLVGAGMPEVRSAGAK